MPHVLRDHLGNILKDSNGNIVVSNQLGKGVQFKASASSEGLTATATSLLQFPANTPFSVLMWVWVKDKGSYSNSLNAQSLFSVRLAQLGWWLYLGRPAAGQYRFGFQMFYDNSVALQVNSSTYVNGGGLYHVALCKGNYQSANTTMFINAVDDTALRPFDMLGISSPVVSTAYPEIGRCVQFGNYALDGFIFSAKVFSKKLSQDEVLTDFYSDGSIIHKDAKPNLITDLRMDEKSGTLISDISGNSINFTANSMNTTLSASNQHVDGFTYQPIAA